MIKAMFYKEWLKIRWAIIALSAILLLALIYIYAVVNYNYRFIEANGFWYNIIFRGTKYYTGMLNYLPYFTGLVIAIVQWVPEIMRKRIKLTFHLPLDEYRVLLVMSGIGTAIVSSMFLMFYALFAVFGYYYFPAEIVDSAMLTLLPKFLLGIAVYLMTSYIIMEPRWLRRILYIIVSTQLADVFMGNWFYNIYDHILPAMVLLTAMLLITIIYPGHRFKKGVLK